MSSRRRAPLAPASLTSLVDVLFILVFAALVQRAAPSSKAAAEAAAEEPGARIVAAVPPAPPAPVERLRQAAISTLASELQQRPAVVVRVSRRGVLTALEGTAGQVVPVELPLIEPVSDPDIAIGYVGEREASRRICAVVAAQLHALATVGASGAAAGPFSLSGALVVIAVDAPLAELTVALVSGLRRDVGQCLTVQGAAAVLLDPAATEKLAPAEEAAERAREDRGRGERREVQPEVPDGGV